MPKITKPETRPIIENFAGEIRRAATTGAKPSKAVIFFRNHHVDRIESVIHFVPIELLRFRKDNGRIASDVLSWERNHGPLDETKVEDQRVLAHFLENKDPDKTAELKNSLIAVGQTEPAIITADGFLINGNRRKLALEQLKPRYRDGRFDQMRVVILPGEGDEGGPPTEREIEQIENRYQLQTTGKAEYYNFDRALSIRRKIEKGMSLDEQLRDDPNFASLDDKAFQKAKKKFHDEYLGPLECVDEYLDYLGRDGQYDTVSTGIGDKEGRWQAFLDYYGSVHVKIRDAKGRLDLGLSEDEVGNVKDIAFKIIRKREISGGAPKAHKIMRELPELIRNKESRKSLWHLNDLPLQLSEGSTIPNEPRLIDRAWGEEHSSEFAWRVNTAYKSWRNRDDEETPLKLLDAALKKLNHERMILENIEGSKLSEARQLSTDIQSRANEIEHIIASLIHNFKKLREKRN